MVVAIAGPELLNVGVRLAPVETAGLDHFIKQEMRSQVNPATSKESQK